MKQVKRGSVSLVLIFIMASFIIGSCNNADTQKQEPPVTETPPPSTVAPDTPKVQINTPDTLVNDSLRTEQNPPAIRRQR